MMFSEHKAVAVASAFLEKAGGVMEDVKLMRLMYLVERKSILPRNVGVTGDNFRKTPNGAALAASLDRLNPQDGMYSYGLWREHIAPPDGSMIRLIAPVNHKDVLSRRELQIVNVIWAEFGAWDKYDLIAHARELPEWRRLGAELTTQTIIECLGFQPFIVAARLRELACLSCSPRKKSQPLDG